MVWRGTIGAFVRGSELAWLLGFSDPVRGVGWNPRGSRAARWRLGRTRALLGLAGAPERRLSVVLVAGAKGKGSTAAFLASILHAAGMRAGLFTSPHLQTYRERVRVDGAMLSERDFAKAISRLRPVVARLRHEHPSAGEPTTFELTLVLAMRAFAERRCAVAIVEVGLGGALDATNALDPRVSIITPISHDHTPILGRSLDAIATATAGMLNSSSGVIATRADARCWGRWSAERRGSARRGPRVRGPRTAPRSRRPALGSRTSRS